MKWISLLSPKTYSFGRFVSGEPNNGVRVECHWGEANFFIDEAPRESKREFKGCQGSRPLFCKKELKPEIDSYGIFQR